MDRPENIPEWLYKDTLTLMRKIKEDNEKLEHWSKRIATPRIESKVKKLTRRLSDHSARLEMYQREWDRHANPQAVTL